MNGEKRERDWTVKMDTLILVLVTETEREMREQERERVRHVKKKVNMKL